MKTSLRFVGIALLSTLAFTGCRKDSTLTPTTDPLELRNPDEVAEPCLNCPELLTCSFKYLDENRSSTGEGHFLMGFGFDNDRTQYGGVPIATDLFDFREDTEEVVPLNGNPAFDALLESLGVPTDTLRNLHIFTDYTECSTGKFEDGFYNNIENWCEERCDSTAGDFDNEMTVATRFNENGNCISRDSFEICLLASDICAMRQVADLVSYSMYPLALIDETAAEPYDKSNLQFADAFASVTFDSREVLGDRNVEEVAGVDLDLKLTDCPIFLSNDGMIPAEFEMKYDLKSGKFFVSADWAMGVPMARASVSVTFSNDPNAEVIQREVIDRPNGFPEGVSIDLPELAEMLTSGTDEVTVLLAVESFVPDLSLPRTINTLMWKYGLSDCVNPE